MNSTLRRAASPSPRAAAIGLALLTAILLFRPVAAAAGVTAEATKCLGSPDNVQAEFDAPAARQIWRWLPALGRSPELETDGPIHVVVLEGDIDLSGLAIGDGTMDAPIVTNVVCVIRDGRAPIFYTDVSRAGSPWK